MTALSSNTVIRKFFILKICLLIGVAVYSQSNIMERVITTPDFKGKAHELIEKVGKDEGLVFSFTNEIDLSYEVNLTKKEVSLKEFLETLFDGRPISYRVIGNKVILLPLKKTETKASVFTQTLRGTVYDNDTKQPLIGVTVIILGSDPIVGTSTDAQGNFRLERVPIGRANLQFSFMGYESIAIPNIEVNSAKEVIINLEMRESSVKLDEIAVSTGRNKGEALNEFSILSSRSISVEETKRYTAGMDDPARMVTSYAGVNASNGSSDIIVRGNSPKYMQWRIDGVEIISPYHLDDQNTTYGALTVLNKNLLGTSDFYMGAFSPEYGNVLSNVMNLRLRQGNNEKFEAAFGFGLMGTDLTIEGPFKKGYRGSYLINYRYSTISLVNDLGLVKNLGLQGIINYQDLTFKAVFPTKKAGTFSIFGLGGLSGFSLKNVTPSGLAAPGGARDASILKDYEKGANLSNLAIINTKTLSESSYLNTSLSYTANGISDNLYEKRVFKLSDGLDSTGTSLQTFRSGILNSAYQFAVTYHSRINARNRIQIGTKYTYTFSKYNQNMLLDYATGMENVTDFENSFHSVSNFISWRYNLNHRITFVSGFHNMNMFLANKSTLEPRIAISLKLDDRKSVHAGYGKHSRAETVHNYFTRVMQPDGTYSEPNKNLDLLMADHFVLGFQTRFTDLLMAKVELYYQHLYNLPVENNDTSYYATINERYDYRYVPLVNEGVARNYGVELTLERFFDNNYYLVFNGSLYDSKYKSLEGVWRNTLYNGNYMVNFLGGKEFKNLGKKNNKILAINAKGFVGGSQRYIPLIRDPEGNVAVDPETNNYWDYKKAFDNKLVHVYSLNLSVSYKINRFRTTHEIFFDLMNVISSRSPLAEYYDESKPDKVGNIQEVPFFPNIMYKVYF